ncbi:uncharacterized protein LOC123557232 [Mercenaria mercenaria]|uniref:uncharacterized protein LOC123557232 n=1 Tax=Mercenaria mercenaria TaxID=6596 RepID=UPI00234E7D43|nr:uncharacterized protein LOC123557232 [Mercenaria mercenaria]
MELKCVWTYGYAMTLRRLLHVSNTNDEEDIDVIKKRHCSVFQLYGEILELEDKSECIQRYKARALVEAGLLAYGVERNKFLFPRGMKGLLPRNSSIFMPTSMYFDTALEIFSDDVFVLERSGRYFRYVDNIERSIILLTRAIDIKGTSFGYHHLALSYIRMLEYNPTKLRHMVESTNQTNIQNMLSFHQQTPESSSTGHSINEKRDIRSQDILSLTTGLATKCNVSDNSQLQTLPFENDLAQGSTNSPNSSISSDTIYTRTPIQCNEQSAHTLQRKHANTNTDLQCELDPMAKTFFPKGQYKREEKSLSQQQSTQTHMIYERSKQNHQTGFNTGNVYAYNSPHRFMPIETPHASKQNKNAKHFFENDSLGLDYTVGRNDYTGIDGRFHRNYVNQYNRFHKMSMNGQNVRQRNMPHTKQHSAKPKLGNAVKCLRSPKLIDYEKHKDVIDTAISHLDKSTRISSNTAALYDKAVLYRQIKQSDKALEVLESLMQNEDDLCSSVTLANAYELAAFCISDIIDNHEIVDEERAQQLIDDRQFYLKSSIEIECNIVAKHPYLGHCWRSAQTLRHIFLSKSKTKRTKQTLKDLWFLYNKLNSHFEVIGVLKELKRLS